MARWPTGYKRKTRPLRAFALVPPEHRASAEEVAAAVGLSVTQLIHLTAEHPSHCRKGLNLPMPEHIGRGAWAWDRRRIQEWKNRHSHERTPPC